MDQQMHITQSPIVFGTTGFGITLSILLHFKGQQIVN